MTPLEYANRYLKLYVPLEKSFAKVTVSQYRSGTAGPDKDQLLGKVWALFSKGKSVEVRVASKDCVEHKTFNNRHELDGLFARPFYGKGCPEDFQVVLQLAALTKHVSADRLQQYCDENMGLDCNGFVGNYLWHEASGNRWDLGAGKTGHGPSTLINELVKPPFIQTMDQIRPGKLYVLGLVNHAGNVIPGGGVKGDDGKAHAGHIIINDPGSFRFDAQPIPGIDVCYEGESSKAPKAVKSFRVVESTGRTGLVESRYGLIKVEKGIFTVYRGCKKSLMRVRIAAV
jgi:hypothetical protein